MKVFVRAPWWLHAESPPAGVAFFVVFHDRNYNMTGCFRGIGLAVGLLQPPAEVLTGIQFWPRRLTKDVVRGFR